jgi:hypothetical protein
VQMEGAPRVRVSWEVSERDWEIRWASRPASLVWPGGSEPRASLAVHVAAAAAESKKGDFESAHARDGEGTRAVVLPDVSAPAFAGAGGSCIGAGAFQSACSAWRTWISSAERSSSWEPEDLSAPYFWTLLAVSGTSVERRSVDGAGALWGTILCARRDAMLENVCPWVRLLAKGGQFCPAQRGPSVLHKAMWLCCAFQRGGCCGCTISPGWLADEGKGTGAPTLAMFSLAVAACTYSNFVCQKEGSSARPRGVPRVARECHLALPHIS